MPMDGAAHHLHTLFSGTPIPSSLLQMGKSAAPVKAMPGVCFHFRSENQNFSVWNTKKKNIQKNRHGLHWTSLTCTYIAESTTCPFATLQLHWLLNIVDVSSSFCKSTMLRASADMGRTVSPQKEGISPLEYEILNFMENSDKPHSFPTRLELLQAGRADLADAVLKEGGWLVTGWDLEELNKEAKSMYASGVDDSTEASSGVTMERVGNGRTVANVDTDKEAKNVYASGVDDSIEASSGVSMERVGNGRNVADVDADGCQQNTMICEEVAERKRGWEKVATLFGLANLKKPEHGGRTSVLDSPASHKDAVHSTLVPPTLPVSLPNDAGHSLDVLPRAEKRKRRKKRKLSKESSAKFNPNQAVNKINEKVDRRNDWIMTVKSKSQEKSSELHDKSISSRIHGLETELITTLNLLQVGRHNLVEDDKSNQIHEELEDASDALEFRETELMHTHKELRTTRAQLTAAEGKLALELIEAKRKIEEKDQRLMESLKVLQQMRTARIVWANPGSEVLLAGSFDGWTSRRKMQKSSAGVFVTALQLYPGSYEIKFIVNGEWRVDPNRPIIHSNGFENNLLTII